MLINYTSLSRKNEILNSEDNFQKYVEQFASILRGLFIAYLYMWCRRCHQPGVADQFRCQWFEFCRCRTQNAELSGWPRRPLAIGHGLFCRVRWNCMIVLCRDGPVEIFLAMGCKFFYEPLSIVMDKCGFVLEGHKVDSVVTMKFARCWFYRWLFWLIFWWWFNCWLNKLVFAVMVDGMHSIGRMNGHICVSVCVCMGCTRRIKNKLARKENWGLVWLNKYINYIWGYWLNGFQLTNELINVRNYLEIFA